ncbi:uncharacterized protein VNE69_06209 [Vairimorpha necatrix]|uniref:Uncharacterized protein n=1 Tax=Vairimorpha necatrix TaxID=6039 RepID=A0AAX4JD56_9MICR
MNLLNNIIITTFIVLSFQLNSDVPGQTTERRYYTNSKIHENYYSFYNPIWTTFRKNKDFDRIIKKELEKDPELTEEGIKREWMNGCIFMYNGHELNFSPRCFLLKLINSTHPILGFLFSMKKDKIEKFEADFEHIQEDLLCALKYKKESEILPYIPEYRKKKILDGVCIYKMFDSRWRTFYNTKIQREIEKAIRKEEREKDANENEFLANIKKNEESELLITHSVVGLAMRSHTYASMAILPVFNYLCNHRFSKFISYITNFVGKKCVDFFKSDKTKKEEEQKAIFEYEDLLDNLEADYEEGDSWENQDSSEYAESFEEYEEKTYLDEDKMSEKTLEENNEKFKEEVPKSEEKIYANKHGEDQTNKADYISKLKSSSKSENNKINNSEVNESKKRFGNNYIDKGFYKMRHYKHYSYCPQ